MHYYDAHRAETDARFRGSTGFPPQVGNDSGNSDGKGINLKHSASRPLEEDPDIVVIPSSTFLLTEKHVQNSVEAARRRSELLDLEQILLGDSSDDRCHHDDDNGNGGNSLINARSGVGAGAGASRNHSESQILVGASECQATVSANPSTSDPPPIRSKSTEQLENLQQELTIIKLKQELAELQKLQQISHRPLPPAGNTPGEAIDSVSSKVTVPEEDSAPSRVSSGPKFRSPFRPLAMRVGGGPASDPSPSVDPHEACETRDHLLSQHPSPAAGSGPQSAQMQSSPKSLNNAKGLPKLSNPQTGEQAHNLVHQFLY